MEDTEVHEKKNISENNMKNRDTLANVVLSFSIPPLQTAIIYHYFYQLIFAGI